MPYITDVERFQSFFQKAPANRNGSPVGLRDGWLHTYKTAEG